MARVYVGNLHSGVSEGDLEDEFRVYGVVRNVWVAKRPPGFGYVEFDDSKDALDAISALDGKNGWCVKLDPYSTEGGGRGGGDDQHVSPSGRRCKRSPQKNTSRKKTKKGMDVEPDKSLAEVARELYISRKKIQKDTRAMPNKIKESVAQALFDLRKTFPKLKNDLKDLYINSAIKINVSPSCKVILIRYPYKLREGFRKIHLKLERELEKKFRENVVVLVPIRRMVPRLHKSAAAYDVILRDMLYPAEILGQQVIYSFHHPMGEDICLRTDFLEKHDPLDTMCTKARNDTEYKLKAFVGVYRFLCGARKYVGFDYMVTKA